MDLIERLSKLDGPDREIDAEIDMSMFGGETVWKTANYTMETYPASRRASKNHVGGFVNDHVPLYTASLDAAIGLIGRLLPGHGFNLWTWPDTCSATIGQREIDFAEYMKPVGKGKASTPAIALCVAVLNARTETAQKRPISTETNVNEHGTYGDSGTNKLG